MKNQQQQEQDQDQETMGLLDSKKNPNFETIHNHHQSSNITLADEERHTMPPPPPPQHFKTTHHQNHIRPSKKINKNEGFTIKNTNLEVTKKLNSLSCNSSLAAPEGDTIAPAPAPPPPEVALVEESGRERLKRHRAEMAGRVRIPDIWGHEDLLKDWIDCTVFDSTLGNNSIMSARAALVQERRSNLRIENQC